MGVIGWVTGQLADCQLADWTTRGCHRRLCVLSFHVWGHLRDREMCLYLCHHCLYRLMISVTISRYVGIAVFLSTGKSVGRSGNFDSSPLYVSRSRHCWRRSLCVAPYVTRLEPRRPRAARAVSGRDEPAYSLSVCAGQVPSVLLMRTLRR